MFKHIHLIFAATVTLGIIHCTCLNGETPVVESYRKKEDEFSKKRFEQKQWSGTKKSDLGQKTFPLKQWDKHYSSLGSKKWDSSVKKVSEKQRFKSDKIEFPAKDIELSEWDGYLADLESRAQISTDQTARVIQDKRVYEMMLQQTENYKETGETLSLRDINRFQFRKNRPEGDVPVAQAGSGE